MNSNHVCKTITKPVHIAAILLLLILVSLAYSNTFFSPPVLDDFHSFIDEPLVHINTLSLQSLALLNQTRFGNERWIPMITFSWDIWLGDGEVFFLHLTNYLIHILSFLSIIYLVYGVSRRAQIHQQSKEILPGSWKVAIWVSGLWVLHPIQTNAVTYLVQRMASLVAMFYVLSVATYVAGRSAHLQKGRLDVKSFLLYFSSLLTMVLGLLSKENAAMIPIMILVTEVWFFRPDLPGRILDFGRKHRILFVSSAVIIIGVIFDILVTMSNGYGHRHFTLTERLLTEARIVVWYISLLLYPNPNRLSLEHDIVVSTSLLNPLSTSLAVIVLMISIYVVISKRHKFPLMTYGFMWLLLNLAIESSVVPLELVFEHRLYLPSIGFALSLVIGIYTFSKFHFPRLPARDFGILSWCLFFILSSILTLATFQRNNSWQDIITINQDNILKAPRHPRAHANLGVAFSRAARWEEAIHEAKIAIELGKKNFEQYCVAANTIILSYINLRDFDKAIEEGERLLKDRSPDTDAKALPNMCLNLALAYQGVGNIQGAFQSVDRALFYNVRIPGKAPGVQERATELLQSIFQEAEARGISLEQGWILDDRYRAIKIRIAQEFLRVGDRDVAMRLLEELAKEDPNNQENTRLLEVMLNENTINQAQQESWSFQQKYVHHPFNTFNICMAAAFLIREKQLPSPFRKAGELFLDHALKLQPDTADPHLLKGWYHYENDEVANAVAEARRALELDDDYSKAWLGLGFFLAKANQPQEAISAFNRALELYPGYPQRRAIMDVIADLEGKSLEESPHRDLHSAAS
jgi:protein O-mannosyl-transferase